MKKLNRRKALQVFGAGAGIFLSPSLSYEAPLVSANSLVEELRKTPRASILELASLWIQKGVNQETMLAAIFMAGIREISPWPCGNELHAVMVVDSIRTIAAKAGMRDGWLLTLWSLDELKRAQEAKGRQSSWKLSKPSPRAKLLTRSRAAKELSSALKQWDWERADLAVTALAPLMGRRDIFEIIWPWAGQCSGSLAHKIIYAAQVERTLRWVDWSAAVPALRSLVKGLLYVGGRSTSASERALELEGTIPSNWMNGKEDADRSLDLLGVLRKATVADAQDAVVRAFAAGYGPRTVWDGIRLASAEIFARRKSDDARKSTAILPVHSVTATHAFAHSFRSTNSDATRRRLILQTAGWLPQLRDHFERRVGLSKVRRGQAISYAEAGVTNATIQHGLPRAAVESHQIKLASALSEECRHAAPRWAAHLAGAAVNYLPAPGAPGTALARKCEEILSKAGVK